jgi:hypothetical protein
MLWHPKIGGNRIIEIEDATTATVLFDDDGGARDGMMRINGVMSADTSVGADQTFTISFLSPYDLPAGLAVGTSNYMPLIRLARLSTLGPWVAGSLSGGSTFIQTYGAGRGATSNDYATVADATADGVAWVLCVCILTPIAPSAGGAENWQFEADWQHSLPA